MSAVVGFFIVETGQRSAAVPGAYLTEAVGAVVDLAGDLLATNGFVADLTVVPAVVNYVDLAGNLGGVSSYGRHKYGIGKYSRYGAMEPVFAAALTVVSTDELAGNLAPSIVFASSGLDLIGTADLAGNLAPSVSFGPASVSVDPGFAGDLSPSIAFAGELGFDSVIAGDLPVFVDFSGTLAFDALIDGDLPFTVTFAGGELTAGPLWEREDPCPVAPWGPSSTCPPSIWTPADPCEVDWEESELCNG